MPYLSHGGSEIQASSLDGTKTNHDLKFPNWFLLGTKSWHLLPRWNLIEKHNLRSYKTSTIYQFIAFKKVKSNVMKNTPENSRRVKDMNCLEPIKYPLCSPPSLYFFCKCVYGIPEIYKQKKISFFHILSSSASFKEALLHVSKFDVPVIVLKYSLNEWMDAFPSVSSVLNYPL